MDDLEKHIKERNVRSPGFKKLVDFVQKRRHATIRVNKYLLLFYILVSILLIAAQINVQKNFYDLKSQMRDRIISKQELQGCEETASDVESELEFTRYRLNACEEKIMRLLEEYMKLSNKCKGVK